MFGNNPKKPIIQDAGDTLAVKNIFRTLQGEGIYVGVPAIFIRLGGCNLACTFCDTEFEDYEELELTQIIATSQKLALNSQKNRVINLVVITGGEPMRQPIAQLCQKLIAEHFLVQIETNGTIYRELPTATQIICSPKSSNGKYYPLQKKLLPKITALKFIVSKERLGYNTAPDIGQKEYDIPVFLQPMDEYDPVLNKANMQVAVCLALKHGYRGSLQTHKILGID